MIDVKIDLNKSLNSFSNRIKVRQGDVGEKMRITLTDNKFSLENQNNLQVKFEGNIRSGDYVEGIAFPYNDKAGEFVYQFKSEDVSIPGAYQRAFIRVYDESGNRISSEDIFVEVLKDADISNNQSKIYVSKLDELLEDFDDDFGEFLTGKEEDYSALDEKSKELNSELSDLKKGSNEIKNTQTEIIQSIEDNDLATKNDLETAKQESSANVIDQIGGAESAILKKELIVDGSEGTAARDENGTLAPFSQVDYDDLNNLEKVVRSEILVSGAGAGIQFVFPLIETLERRYPYIFKGLTTNAEKFKKMHELLSSLYLSVEARGGGIRNNTGILGNYARCYSKTSSGVVEAIGDEYVNTSQNFKSMFSDLSNSNRYYQIDTGSMLFLLVSKNNDNNDVGCVSDGVIPSWIEVKDIRLIVELEVNGRTIIESFIAANHRENLATQDESEAGTDNTKAMTPLGTAQQTDKRAVTIAGNQTIGGIKNFRDGLMIDDVPVFGITRNVVFDDDGVGGYFNAADKFSLGAVGKIDKVVIVWSRVDDSAGTLLNYSWSQTVLFPDDIILGNSYRVQLTSENYKFITFKNESGILTISGASENNVAPNRIYRIKRIIAYIKN